MQQLTSPTALGRFEQALAAAGRGVFLMDFDGTLAPFAVDAADARPWPGLPEALDALADTGRARIVVVTGRCLRTALPRVGTRHRFETWGSHGRERLLPDGRHQVMPVDEHVARALAVADEWSEAVQAAGGRVEAKPGSLAFHWRGAGIAQLVRIRHLVTRNFQREAFEGLLELHVFDGGLELRAAGQDKGDVVRAVLAEEGGGAAAYLGDDLTDEDAFAALRGIGLGVLVRQEFRATAADVWMRPPGELLGLLSRWHEILAAAS